MKWTIAAILLLVLPAVAAVAAVAFGAASISREYRFPGGATSIRETYGDWKLTCYLEGQSSAGSRSCYVTQHRVDPLGRRVVGASLEVSDLGVKGNLILPFGLKLDRGVTLWRGVQLMGQLDFDVCLPAGCLSYFQLNSSMIASLRNHHHLEIKMFEDGGRAIERSLSLLGFDAAVERAKMLLS